MTCSAVTRRSRGPRRPTPLRPGRRDVHFALERAVPTTRKWSKENAAMSPLNNLPAITPIPAGPGNFPVRRSHCASSGREECDGERKARAGHLFEPPDRSPTGSPASATPFSLCYASSPSTVREEEAQQRVKERSRRSGAASRGPRGRRPGAPRHHRAKGLAREPARLSRLLSSSEKGPPALRPAPGKRTRTPL